MPKVILSPTKDRSLNEAVREVFQEFGGGRRLIKSSGEVYLKINGIDFKPHVFTSPQLIASVIDYFYSEGARKLYVMENCTQGNFTRLVFRLSGIDRVVREHKAQPLYLDEEKALPIHLPRLGYQVDSSRTIVEKLIKRKSEYTYINLPKLKTHSMTVMTLGLKNQLGLIQQYHRINDHNFNLHKKIADIYQVIQPDFTLIDALEATIHGHYPPAGLAKDSVVPLDLLIGGEDTLAVDTVASRILGYDIKEVEHLRLAAEWGLGCGNLGEIELLGDLSAYTQKYSYELLPEFPGDVRVIEGKKRLCREGCQGNTMALMQMLWIDFKGKGGFTIVMGKGHSSSELKQIKGPVLVVGPCAITEVAATLRERLGKKQVLLVKGDNNLRGIFAALARLMKVNPLTMVPLNPLILLALAFKAKLKGSKATALSLLPR